MFSSNIFRKSVSASVIGLGLLAGCADDQSGPVVEPPVADGKADIGERVDFRGSLGFGSEKAVTGSFTEDLEFHAFAFEVGANADVTLGITRSGTSRNIDTTLFVYGPRNANGGYGTASVAFDDDSGWSRHSRIANLKLPAPGTWLAVVGTRDGRGRGNYRLDMTCNSNDCTPPVVVESGCHPDLAAAIDACVADSQMNAENPWAQVVDDFVAECAGAETVARARDALCATAGAPQALCAMSIETLDAEVIPVCRAEVLKVTLDNACVFGSIYGDLFRRAEAMVVIDKSILDASSNLDAVTSSQILAAVRASAFDDALAIDEVFDWVDGGEINRVDLWDASNRRPFTAFEFGAGDNSFGMIFDAGTNERVATINDGDFYDCNVTWGAERRRCQTDSDCGENMLCNGRGWEGTVGRCVVRGADTQPNISTSCSSHADCGLTSGLLCAGIGLSDEGLCLPAWMRSSFYSEPGVAIPDNDPNGATAEIRAFGLATVAMDTHLTLLISHARISDLRITLQGGDGTEAVVFNGDRDGGELWLDDVPVRGLPGDESVNVAWRLKVVDVRGGSEGTISRFGLKFTTRWD